MSKFVDQGSEAPLIRAVKASLVLSGEKAYSLESPNGLEGTSASREALTETGSPARPFSMSATKSCDTRPSFQVSQCRTNRRSNVMPVCGDVAFISRRSLEHRRVSQSG